MWIPDGNHFFELDSEIKFWNVDMKFKGLSLLIFGQKKTFDSIKGLCFWG